MERERERKDGQGSERIRENRKTLSSKRGMRHSMQCTRPLVNGEDPGKVGIPDGGKSAKIFWENSADRQASSDFHQFFRLIWIFLCRFGGSGKQFRAVGKAVHVIYSRGKKKSVWLDSPKRILYVDVSIERNGAEVEDARGGAHDVEGDPRVTELRPEHPVLQQVVHHCERHHQARDEEIRDGQTGEEEVPDAPQAPVRVDGYADEDVPRDRHEDHDRRNHPCNNGGWQFFGTNHQHHGRCLIPEIISRSLIAEGTFFKTIISPNTFILDQERLSCRYEKLRGRGEDVKNSPGSPKRSCIFPSLYFFWRKKDIFSERNLISYVFTSNELVQFPHPSPSHDMGYFWRPNLEVIPTNEEYPERGKLASLQSLSVVVGRFYAITRVERHETVRGQRLKSVPFCRHCYLCDTVRLSPSACSAPAKLTENIEM